MHRNRHIAWGAVLLILLLVNLPIAFSSRVRGSLRDLLSPFQNGISAIVTRLSDSASVLTSKGERAVREQDLKTQVAELQLQVGEMSQLETENVRLREALRFTRRSEHDLIAAEVVGRGGSTGWWETIRLNKGSKDGIRPKLAVITGAGLVGEVLSVSKYSSDVLLITDRNCQVAGRFMRTGAFGIVVGASSTMEGNPQVDMCYPVTPIRADYVAKHSRIKEGDKVMTSGLGGVYPEGLHIGTVRSMKVHESGLYQCAYVIPAADLLSVRYVFVIKRDEETAEGEPEGGTVLPVVMQPANSSGTEAAQ